MAESTLSNAYADLRAEIGYRVGYGRTSSNWTTDQINEINAVLKKGLRRFYFQEPDPRTGKVHDWSFLRISTDLSIWPNQSSTLSGAHTATTTVTAAAAMFYATMIGRTLTIGSSTRTISGVTSTTVCTITSAITATAGTAVSITSTGDYTMPDNFGRVDSPVTYEDNTGWLPLGKSSEFRIRELRMRDVLLGAGQPLYYATRSRPVDMTTGQRFEMMVWPEPSAVMTLKYRYVVLPDNIDATNLYHLGGMAHTETVLAACLAASELHLDDHEGPFSEDFRRRLVSSIDFDKSQAAENLGRSRDGESADYATWRSQEVTYNGVLY